MLTEEIELKLELTPDDASTLEAAELFGKEFESQPAKLNLF